MPNTTPDLGLPYPLRPDAKASHLYAVPDADDDSDDRILVDEEPSNVEFNDISPVFTGRQLSELVNGGAVIILPSSLVAGVGVKEKAAPPVIKSPPPPAGLAASLFGTSDLPDFAVTVDELQQKMDALSLKRVKRFPMPRITGRFAPEFSPRWGHYILPDIANPTEMSTYPRVTTISKTLEDTEFLNKWKTRKMLQGLKQCEAVLDTFDAADIADGVTGAKAAADFIADRLRESAGADDAAAFGDCVHAWTEFIDLGLGTIEDVPEIVRDHVRAYVLACREFGVIADAKFVERIIHNPVTGVAGRVDRMAWMPDGTLVILDVKTSKTLKLSVLGFGVQLAQYATAAYILSEDGSRWEPMPPVSRVIAYIAHIPSESEDGSVYCEIVPIDLVHAIADMERTVDVREARKNAKNLILEGSVKVMADGTVAAQKKKRRKAAKSAPTETREQLMEKVLSAKTGSEIAALEPSMNRVSSQEDFNVAEARYYVLHGLEVDDLHPADKDVRDVALRHIAAMSDTDDIMVNVSAFMAIEKLTDFEGLTRLYHTLPIIGSGPLFDFARSHMDGVQRDAENRANVRMPRT